MEYELLAAWKRGAFKNQGQIHTACLGDPRLLGRLMVLIQSERTKQNAAASAVSGGSNAAASPPPVPSDSKESEGVSTEWKDIGEAASVLQDPPKKQARRRVSRKARISYHESETSASRLPGYGCWRYLIQRCCCLRFFW